MAESSIEWTEHTWNPVTGCTKLSPGCKHCYAETMAHRLSAMRAPGYETGFALAIHAERLMQPIQRRPPTVYFVNSMSDLFHEDVPDAFIDQVFAVMAFAQRHTFQVLTKRGERLARYTRSLDSLQGFRRLEAAAQSLGCTLSFRGAATVPWPISNVWLGVSVEDRRYGVPRIAHLQRAPAAVRFLSVEPLLGDVGELDLTGIHWVIVGGESGAKARPMSAAWAENVRRQAVDQDVAFFFKQWGTWGEDGVRRSKKVNGRELHGRLWDEFPVRVVIA
jgi:protein gp37